MIDPDNITRYNRKVYELEEFVIFCVFVAGHSAHNTAAALDRFLSHNNLRFKDGSGRISHVESPFKKIRSFLSTNSTDKLAALLKASGIGCYKRNAKFLNEIVHSGINLRTCTVADLEEFTGIGSKTSRFFVLHSRKDVNDIAVIDTHILKYLGALGHSVPKATPSKKKYRELEKVFVAEAGRAGKTVAAFDLEIWKRYRVPRKE